MDTTFPVDSMQQRRDVVGMIGKHGWPSFVRGYEVQFSETWDGYPAIHVDYYAPAMYDPTDEEIGQLHALVRAVTADVRQAIPDRAVYVRFVGLPEELR